MTVRSGDVTLNKGTKVLWRAPNHQAAKLVMQGDGNLVALDAAGHPVWDSGTEGHAGARLALQGDGNLVVYSVHDVALWASNTSG